MRIMKNKIILLFVFCLTIIGMATFREVHAETSNSAIEVSEETLDSWMPDRELQRAIATEFGVDIPDITKELLAGTNISSLSIRLKGTVSEEYLTRYIMSGQKKSYDENFFSIRDLTGLEYLNPSITRSLDLYAVSQDDIKNMTVPVGIILDSVYSQPSSALRVNNIVDFYNSIEDKFDLESRENFSMYFSAYAQSVEKPFNVNENNYKEFVISLEDYYIGVEGFKDLPGVSEVFTSSMNFSIPQEGSGAYSILNVYLGDKISSSWDGNYISYKCTMDESGNIIYRLEEYSIGSTDYKDLAGKTSADDYFDYFRGNPSTAICDSQNASFTNSQGTTVSLTVYPQILIPISFQEEGSVSVSYVDQDGKEIASSKEITGIVGEAYDVSTVEYLLDVPDYKIDVSSLPSNAVGVYTSERIDVTYVYDRLMGQVKVEYRDEEGNVLKETTVLKGNTGEAYETRPEEFPGYELKETPENAAGIYTEDTQIVTYVYVKTPVAGEVESSDNSHSSLTGTQITNLPNTGANKTNAVILIIGWIITLILISYLHFRKWFSGEKQK